MADQAYYANDVYQPNGRNPAGVRVAKAEWIPIVEDEDVVPGRGEVAVTDHIREGARHRIQKTLRDMTAEEIDRRDANQAVRDEDALWQSRIPLFEAGTTTDLNDKQAIAHILRRL